MRVHYRSEQRFYGSGHVGLCEIIVLLCVISLMLLKWCILTFRDQRDKNVESAATSTLTAIGMKEAGKEIEKMATGHIPTSQPGKYTKAIG